MLSQTAVYALRAIGYIAKNKNEKPVLSREISEAMGIPQNFLSKIMYRLVQEGFLESRRGTNGGFLLTRPGNKISLMEIVSLFMNVESFDQCFLGLPSCNGGCSLHKEWKPLMKKFKTLLSENKVDNISFDLST